MILTKEDSGRIKGLMLEGLVFIYPTDTIYGLGCDATSEKSVKRIRDMKKREKKPFSVIAPSKKWILENCFAEKEDLVKLPGPYTLVLKLRRKCVASGVNPGLETLGVRIPDHWFSKTVGEAGIPVVTTSVNVSSQKFMTSIDNIDVKIRKLVDFIVYEGPLRGSPSEIINLTAKTH